MPKIGKKWRTLIAVSSGPKCPDREQVHMEPAQTHQADEEDEENLSRPRATQIVDFWSHPTSTEQDRET